MCKSVVNDLRHGKYICKSGRKLPPAQIYDYFLGAPVSQGEVGYLVPFVERLFIPEVQPVEACEEVGRGEEEDRGETISRQLSAQRASQ